MQPVTSSGEGDYVVVVSSHIGNRLSAENEANNLRNKYGYCEVKEKKLDNGTITYRVIIERCDNEDDAKSKKEKWTSELKVHGGAQYYDERKW